MLSYDIPHNRPWDWRVSAYTWTKSIACGSYVVAAIAMILRRIDDDGALWRVGVPVLSGVFLALTGILLIADLKQPMRFHYLFLRPQWKSWLVRGAVLITAFAAILAVHFVFGVMGNGHAGLWLTHAGVPIGLGTAVYTAYLFAQAKARDLWQNPMLPPHFVVQSLLAGAAVWAVVAPSEDVAWGSFVALFTGIHLLMVAGELTMTHGTAHARMAAHEITHGEFRGFFLAAMVLSAIGLATPWTGVFGAVPALFGLLAWEHAHVQAGQSVPLA